MGELDTAPLWTRPWARRQTGRCSQSSRWWAQEARSQVLPTPSYISKGTLPTASCSWPCPLPEGRASAVLFNLFFKHLSVPAHGTTAGPKGPI